MRSAITLDVISGGMVRFTGKNGDNQRMTQPTLIVHGGAGAIPLAEHADYLSGCRAAFEVAWKLLEQGGTALDAVEAAVRSMEDNPAFDAGVGSVLNSVGEIELDAMIMDGQTLSVGAVAAVRGIANPITLARRIMENTSHSMLVGDGARRYAEQIGLRLCSQAELTVPREVARYRESQQKRGSFQAGHDTVGAVALDRYGNIAAGDFDRGGWTLSCRGAWATRRWLGRGPMPITRPARFGDRARRDDYARDPQQNGYRRHR